VFVVRTLYIQPDACCRYLQPHFNSFSITDLSSYPPPHVARCLLWIGKAFIMIVVKFLLGAVKAATAGICSPPMPKSDNNARLRFGTTRNLYSIIYINIGLISSLKPYFITLLVLGTATLIFPIRRYIY